MISSEKIVEVMLCEKKENGISDIKITPEGDIASHLDNRIDSEKPYFLAVRRCEEEQKICIYVSGFLNNCKDSDIYRKLMLLNLGFGCSCISINPDDGKLFFKLEHFFEEDEEPSVDFFAGLFFRYLREARFIERILLYESMLDNGLSKESAEQFMKTFFGETSGFRFVDWDQTLMEEPVSLKHFKEHES